MDAILEKTRELCKRIQAEESFKAYVAANEGLTILEAKWLTEDYAIAINKADTQLLADIDAALDALIADGTVQRIIDKYIKAD